MPKALKIVKAESNDAVAAQYLADNGDKATREGLIAFVNEKGFGWADSTVTAFASRIKKAAHDTETHLKAQLDESNAPALEAAAKSANVKVVDLRKKIEARMAFWRKVAIGQAAAFPKNTSRARSPQSAEDKLLALLG